MAEPASQTPENPGLFRDTRCLFCDPAHDRERYAAALHTESFTPYAFSARRVRNREHYRIVQCEACGLIRSNPVLDEDSVNRLYASSGFIFPEEAPFAAEAYAALLTRLLHRHPAPSASLLELGSSCGFFLEAAKKAGFNEVLGFEPSEACCHLAPPEIRPRIIQDIFRPEHLKGQTFDVACGFQVVDHLANPLEVLTSIAGHLNPGGRLFLICHDAGSLSVRIMGKHSPVFDVEHIYLFSRKTLALLCERAGFRVLESGAVTNRYPLGYWLRMLPLTRPAVRLLPEKILKIPVSLRAGNQYIYAIRN